MRIARAAPVLLFDSLAGEIRRYTTPGHPDMSIPTHEQAMLPVLSELADGEARHRRALADSMAAHFGLTADERAQMLPSGKAPVSWR
jgi:restriction system protein